MTATGHARPLAVLAGLWALLGALPSARAGHEAASVYLHPGRATESPRFWWPGVVLERGSSHLTGERSVDETRFGVAVAYRTRSLSPHVRALLSPSLGAYQNLAASAGAGLRIHFELAGVPLSSGVGLSLEARLRDSLWLAYATPLELGTTLYRGPSAEHHVFIGIRRSMAGALINSFLLDPNGYDNENSLELLSALRYERPWQLYVSIVFGRRVE